MKFKLIKKDFKLGKGLNVYECPVARCVQRTTGIEMACAGLTNIIIENKIYKTPSHVKKFIRDYDNRRIEEFRELEFELDIPIDVPLNNSDSVGLNNVGNLLAV